MPDQPSRPPTPPRATIRRRDVVEGAAGHLSAGAVPEAWVGQHSRVEQPEADKADDTELLALCAQAVAMDGEAAAASAPDWDGVVARLAALPARTWAGIQAKARLIQHLAPWLPDTGDSPLGNGESTDCREPEDQLLASLLRDLLAPGTD